MKKLFLIVTAATALSGLPVFGQGYFLFTGPVRGVWDNWSIAGVARTSTNNHLAFLWATSGTPLVDAIASRIPTNAAFNFNHEVAWNAIMTDPNFHFAYNTDGSLVVATSAANGAWQYPSSGAAWIPIAGTSPGVYQVFVIGWGGYDNPAAAAAVAAPLGWSNPFAYTATGLLGTPLTMVQSGMLPFGVMGIPEPAVFSLLGLGAATLLPRQKRWRIRTTEHV